MATGTQVSPDRLRALRRASGLTQRQLAGLAGVSLGWIANAENGYVPRRSVALGRVLAALLNDDGGPAKAAAVQEPGGHPRHGAE